MAVQEQMKILNQAFDVITYFGHIEDLEKAFERCLENLRHAEKELFKENEKRDWYYNGDLARFPEGVRIADLWMKIDHAKENYRLALIASEKAEKKLSVAKAANVLYRKALADFEYLDDLAKE